MRKTLLLEKIDFIPTFALTFPDAGCLAEGGCRPFTHTINGENGCFFERAGKKGAGGVTHMVVTKENPIITNTDFTLDNVLDPELFFQPIDHRVAPNIGGFGESIQSREQNTLELHKGCLVE